MEGFYKSLNGKMYEGEFVSFEIAKRLKEKGFYEPCRALYRIEWDDDIKNTNVYLEEVIGDGYKNDKAHDDLFAAPTLDAARSWLMVHCDIFVDCIYTMMPPHNWLIQYTIMIPNKPKYIVKKSDKDYSYEKDCINAGIIEALNIIDHE